MTRTDLLDEARDVVVRGCTAPRNVGEELRVGQIQNSLEASDIRSAELRERRLHEGFQDGIELTHSASATPPQPRDVGGHSGRGTRGAAPQ
jgi:hypothetical protein